MVSSLALLAGLSVSALAQQGWSRAQSIRQNGQEATVNAVYYDGDLVWVVGAGGLVARSDDEGRSFQEMDLGVSSGLNDVFGRKDDLWIVGDEGAIFLSTDGGRSFVKSLGNTRSGRSAQAEPPRDYYSVQFIDEETGFIVGDEGLILASNDGGVSWREQRSGTTAQLFHLSFQGKRGWVVGTGGAILHTDDWGRNWYPQTSGTTDDLNRVYFVTEKVGIVTGDNGALLRTDNGGATWERVALKTREPLFGISFIDRKTGWVVGHNGRVIRTYDGGVTWVEQESGTKTDLFAVSFRKNNGFAIGKGGLVMRYYEKR
ncbi:MAG TPA: YCF48-related protein [Blastocatellia bacterium]|nr:YCF48-related protein [Blastocatellia bacterium]